MVADTLTATTYDSAGNIHTVDSASEVADTLHHIFDSGASIVHSFIPQSTREIIPVIYNRHSDQWFLYVLLALALIVSVIWYYIPEHLTNIFSLSAKTIMRKTSDKGTNGPGFAVTFFFLLNSLITTSFFLSYIVRHQLFGFLSSDMNDWLLWAYIAIGLTAFSLFKLLLVKLSGFLFGTEDMAQKQQIIYFNSYNAMGVILLPLLFVLLIVRGTDWLYFMLLLIAGMFVYRWIQIVVIGIKQSRFNTFHLILYLCTLEIIPLVVLLRIFM